MTGLNKKVLVALSGGVDSMLTAALLLEQGYAVEGITLDLYDGSEDLLIEAKQCADQLGIVHHILSCREVFETRVVNPFIEDYIKGKTPNPCLKCNQHIKYGLLFDWMVQHDYDFLATGHYARIEWNEKRDRWDLLKGKAERKDQSYFLYHLSQWQLSHLLLPLGNYYSKAAVRDDAHLRGLKAAHKKDSDGICFMKGLPYGDFIAQKSDGYGRGHIVDYQGHKYGQHLGFYRYTRGQKKGLPETVPKGYVVVETNPADYTVIVGEEAKLYASRLFLDNLQLQADVLLPLLAEIRIFNWGYSLKGSVFQVGDQIQIEFETPVRGIVAGQHAVFFKGERVLGGGIITNHGDNIKSFGEQYDVAERLLVGSIDGRTRA